MSYYHFLVGENAKICIFKLKMSPKHDKKIERQ